MRVHGSPASRLIGRPEGGLSGAGGGRPSKPRHEAEGLRETGAAGKPSVASAIAHRMLRGNGASSGCRDAPAPPASPIRPLVVELVRRRHGDFAIVKRVTD